MPAVRKTSRKKSARSSENGRKKSSPSAIETLVRPTAMLHRVREPTVFGCPLRLNYASHTGQKHL